MEEHVVVHERGCEILARFGKNPNNQPMYRIVRADTRRQWSVGEFRPKYPKYGTYWVIETWCAPEKYGSQSEWEDCKDGDGVSYLGPFPNQGDYEFVLPVMDMKTGEFIAEPGEQHLQQLGAAIAKSQGLTRSERWVQIQNEQEAAKQARMKKLEDMIADAKPLRGGEAERKHQEALEEAAKRLKIPEAPTGARLALGE